MHWYVTLITLSVALPAYAADWAMRNADRVMSQAEVELLTAGQTLTFFDEGKSKYSVGGSYSYTNASGESAYGQYAVAEDGKVCINYQNGFSRCDLYVQNGDRIILLTENGLRFPIRQASKN